MAPHAAAAAAAPAAGAAGDAAQKAVIEGTLTVANVAANRTRCDLPKGVAAFTNSDMFKSAVSPRPDSVSVLLLRCVVAQWE